jgi:hypothetical protein
MSRKALWCVCLIALAGLVGGSLMWSGPVARGQQSVTPCSLADDALQPDQPLELNHVALGTLVKTLAMEKEVFACLDREGRRIDRIRDVETFIEIVERAVQGSAGPTMRRAELSLQVAQCTKDFVEGTVGCSMSKPDRVIRRLDGDVLDFRSCQPHASAHLQPRDPVEMGTVPVDAQLVKTTKVEKEVLDCEGRIVDLYLFTDIVERRQLKPGPTVRPISWAFLGIACIKTVPGDGLGSVDTNDCYKFDPTLIGPKA